MKKHVTYELEAEELETLIAHPGPGDVEIDVEDADTVRLVTRAHPDRESIGVDLDRLEFKDGDQVFRA